MVGTVSFVSVLLSSVEVWGTSACPTAQEVRAELKNFENESSASHHRFEIESTSTGLAVVHSDSGAKRHVATDSGCPSRAKAAAVIIHAWVEELEAPLETVEFPKVLPPVKVVTPAKESHREWEAGSSILATFGDNEPVLGVSIYGAAWAKNNPWGLVSSLGATLQREYAFDTGGVRYSRAWLGVGAARRWFPHENLLLMASLEALGGLFSAQGVRFAENLQTSSFDVGSQLGFRASTRQGKLRFFAQVTLQGWLIQQRLVVEGSGNNHLAPRFEPQAQLGAYFSYP